MDDLAVQKSNPNAGYLTYTLVAVIFLCIGIFVGVLIAGYSDGKPKADIMPKPPVSDRDGIKDINVPKGEDVFCTADAKICPDGSAVGRMPPNCEFAPCPNGSSTETAPLPTVAEEGVSIEGEAGWGSVDPSGLGGM